MQRQMELSIWLHEHHHGTDVVTVLTPEGYTPTKHEVIEAAGLDWDGERGDEYLDHQQNFPLDAEVLADPKGYGVPVIKSPAQRPVKAVAQTAS